MNEDTYDWLSASEHIDHDRLLTQFDSLRWHGPDEDGKLTGPMSPMLAIQEWAKGTGQRVVRVAWNGYLDLRDTGGYPAQVGVYGVELRFADGIRRACLLDGITADGHPGGGLIACAFITAEPIEAVAS